MIRQAPLLIDAQFQVVIKVQKVFGRESRVGGRTEKNHDKLNFCQILTTTKYPHVIHISTIYPQALPLCYHYVITTLSLRYHYLETYYKTYKTLQLITFRLIMQKPKLTSHLAEGTKTGLIQKIPPFLYVYTENIFSRSRQKIALKLHVPGLTNSVKNQKIKTFA